MTDPSDCDKWNGFRMIQTLSDALAERGYDTLTPVQEAVTDPELRDSDLLVSAQTGSGKTVGFGLAIGPTILGDADTFGPAGAPLALVVAPTRELAFQVTRELDWLYAKAGARVASCVGGMDMRDERRTLERGVHIVVGTPGRLRDHIQRGSLDMSGLRAIVLDEADEMLDLGFREELEFMLGAAPAERRTLMFSATVPPMIVTLASHYQRDAVRVTTLSGKSQHADITYQALRVAQSDVENAIINLLRFHEAENAIIFANTRAAVSRLAARLANRGFSVVSLSGELSQSERTHALQAMRDGRARVCVATDVAARGIDLPNLELVIHADLPSSADGLLHRSGRTGRAGRKGISALVVPPKSVKKAERLLKTGHINAEWTTAPGAEEILRRDEERLLADPVWDVPPTEDEAAFAARLLAARSPETVAAAYLRLFRARHSAPEELVSPDVQPERKERKPFGPSVWFALSVGRDDRAEPRWLLPLLLRAGGLDKDEVGAIRVQKSETFVEITEAGATRFLTSLGDQGEVDEGLRARRLDGPPQFERAPHDGARPGPDRRPPPKPRPAATAKRTPSDRSAAPQRRKPETAKAPDVTPDATPAPRPAPKPAKPAEGDGRTFAAKQHRDPAKKKPRSPGDAPPKRFGPGKPKPGGGKPGSGAKRPSPPAIQSVASDTSKRFSPPGTPSKPRSNRDAPGKRGKDGMKARKPRKP